MVLGQPAPFNRAFVDPTGNEEAEPRSRGGGSVGGGVSFVQNSGRFWFFGHQQVVGHLVFCNILFLCSG